MNIKDRLRKREETRGVFGVVGALRLGGKTTLSGTLPGKTLLLQAHLLESGSNSAKNLANENGNELDVLDFVSYSDLMSLLLSEEILEYDNIYIDGISAINEMKFSDKDIQLAKKKNVWDAFRDLGEALRDFLKLAKTLSTEHGKNVFITLAYKAKYGSDGAVISLEPDVKGSVTTSEIQRLCPVVLGLDSAVSETGETNRWIVTKSDNLIPARIDSLLDHNNPGKIPADLTVLINLVKGK